MSADKEILAQLDNEAKEMQRLLFSLLSDDNTAEQANAIAAAGDGLTTWRKNCLGELVDSFEKKG